MSDRLWWCFSVYASRLRQTSAMISSLYIVIILLKEFHRRADFWARISSGGAYGSNDWFLGCIIDVSEVPCEEVVNAVHCRDRNMQRVGFCAGGNTAF